MRFEDVETPEILPGAQTRTIIEPMRRQPPTPMGASTYVKTQDKPPEQVALVRAMQLAGVLALAGFLEGFIIGALDMGVRQVEPVLWGAAIGSAQGALGFLVRWLREGKWLDGNSVIRAAPTETVAEVRMQQIER